MRSHTGHSGASHKAKSMGTGAKAADMSPPIRISRSPPPRRGFGGREVSTKHCISSDRAGRQIKNGDDTGQLPQRRSISVEPQPHASRSGPRASRGSAVVRRGTSAIRSSSDGGAVQGASLSKESSKTSAATSGHSSAPGSVAATLLGGSLADRIGRGGLAPVSYTHLTLPTKA